LDCTKSQWPRIMKKPKFDEKHFYGYIVTDRKSNVKMRFKIIFKKSEHWAVLNKNARHLNVAFLYIFLVFRWHNLQRPCGPLPRLWFTPSKRMSHHCDIKPDAALPGAVRSEYSKLRTTCRRNSRRLCVNPPSSHCRNVHRIDKQRPIPFLPPIDRRYAAASPSRSTPPIPVLHDLSFCLCLKEPTYSNTQREMPHAQLIHFINITIRWLPWNSVYKFRNGLFPRYRCIAHLAH
ncbi:hypothetical protein T07_8387, partial [Trichinella nelsoni]